ncbi:hypothetical protein M067_2536 [Bacteroides fragilis str. J-143-4]|nr:hypothetical protein M067_2536 [Bacteroides fragilis str. J-143-4]EYE47632.1 hypothetical protein M127_2584 [Bacteroides fragilis str. S6L5]
MFYFYLSSFFMQKIPSCDISAITNIFSYHHFNLSSLHSPE